MCAEILRKLLKWGWTGLCVKVLLVSVHTHVDTYMFSKSYILCYIYICMHVPTKYKCSILIIIAMQLRNMFLRSAVRCDATGNCCIHHVYDECYDEYISYQSVVTPMVTDVFIMFITDR